MAIDTELTVADLFRRAVAEHADQPALWIKPRPGESTFSSLSWSELALQVAGAVHVLDSLGLMRGDRLVQISENRREWIVLDLACHFTGVIHVPLHDSLAPRQMADHIAHCEANCIVASHGKLLESLMPLVASCDCRWIAYDGEPTSGAEAWTNLIAVASPADLKESRMRPDDVATILYTSGTTGEPKGVVLTQRNLSSNAQAAVEMYGEAERERKLNVLPLSHIYARTCDLYCWLVRGSELALAESRTTFMADLQAFQPSTINAVPYLYERIWRGLRDKGLADSPNILRGVLGGRIRSCSSGGAPLPEAVYDYFHSQGVPLLSGYGLTECSPVLTMSTKEHHARGSCGRILPGIEMRIADDGEILTRGPHVMQGYYRRDDEVLRDGWFHTGDLGEFDVEGFLRIRGRKKEMIVLATGKKIAPCAIEQALCSEPIIAQAVVVGEGKNYLAALLVPNAEALQKLCVSRGIDADSPSVASLFEEAVTRALACFAAYEHVKRFTLLSQPFSLESGELTPKLSIRRDAVAQNHAAAIEAMYACH